MDCGCLVPSTGRYGSLKSGRNSEPHHSSIGKRLARRNLTIIRSTGDQDSTLAMRVRDQSIERISTPISAPLVRTSAAGDGVTLWGLARHVPF